MVAIKGMETQTDCKKCPFMAMDDTDELISPMICIALWATKYEIRHCTEGRILDDCPLVEIITCKDCRYLDKEEKYCKYLANTTGWFESGCDAVYTGADFYCKDAERRK